MCPETHNNRYLPSSTGLQIVLAKPGDAVDELSVLINMTPLKLDQEVLDNQEHHLKFKAADVFQMDNPCLLQ